jgi:hypothetical protein
MRVNRVPTTSLNMGPREEAGSLVLWILAPSAACPTLKPSAPATAKTFRFYQPAGKGPANRRNLMWVREVELFPPQAGEGRHDDK